MPASLENNLKGWKIEFDKTLVASQAVTIEVDLILGKALEMYPAEIAQKDKQLVSIKISTSNLSESKQEPTLSFAGFKISFYLYRSIGDVQRKSLRLSTI